MAELKIDKKNIYDLLRRKVTYIIPDYQRPYAWNVDTCSTLWEDLVDFCIPNNDVEAFNPKNDFYYLGSIVTYYNKENDTLEIIDGQQRLTSIILLLRAFYEMYKNYDAGTTLGKKKEKLEQCIWQTNEDDEKIDDELKIMSEVATDEHINEFMTIVKTGIVPEKMTSKYATNYKLFSDKLKEYSEKYNEHIPSLINRILSNCILLPIEAENQDNALTIFSTLNDRGLSLADSDIFKSQLYKYYKSIGKADDFIKDWKDLNNKCKSIFFDEVKDKYMDELFTRYMYFERAKLDTSKTTTIALRKFYEKDKYSLLKSTETFENLKSLANFWEKVYKQDKNYFSTDILKKFHILKYAPNRMWTFLISVYYMANHKNLNLEEFSSFLSKTIGFMLAYQFTAATVTSFRTPIYPEMRKIVKNEKIDFSGFLFDEEKIRNDFNNCDFSNNKTITKSILIWWTYYYNSEQKLLDSDLKLDIEHIYAKNRVDNDQAIEEIPIESIGNKSVLENNINIRASDYRFSDKKKYYTGTKNDKEATKIKELLDLSNNDDFTKEDIISRKDKIINGFIDYLRKNFLLKNN